MVAEYKYVVLDANSGTAVSWQAGNNSVLAVQRGEATVQVFDNWSATAMNSKVGKFCFQKFGACSEIVLKWLFDE